MATVKGPDQDQARACAEYARRLKKWCDDPTWEKIARMWDSAARAEAAEAGARAGQGEG
jgi:hypothetical protein